MSLTTKQIFLIKMWYFAILFIFLFVAWMFYHELAHFHTCESLGYTATITFDRGRAMTRCPDIEKASIIGKYLYLMMPYIIEFVIFVPIFWLLYIKNLELNDSVVRILPYVIAIDICYNYFSSLFAKSDFLKVFSLLGNYWYFSVIPVILILIGILLLAKRDLVLLIKKVRKII